jgi:carboxypeptidase Q
MKRLAIFVIITVAFAATTTAQDSSDRIISEALKPSAIDSNLQQLTDEIGGRVSGSPAMDAAIRWGADGLKNAGANSVKVEEFSMPHGWSEGATKMTVSISPAKYGSPAFAVRVVSVGMGPALALQRHIRIVDIGEGDSEDFFKAGNIAGALLLVHTNEMYKWEDLFDEYVRAPQIIEHAVAAHALSIAFQSTRPNDLLYRHTNSVNGEIERLPQVIVAREDAARIARLLASGHNALADIEIPNHVAGPIKTANVIGELKGSEKPDEFVVLGAHLDSWELGTGALDNGCNAALVIDALRAISASGLRPRRSIRFILFSGEEQGLIGSNAYVVAHRNELDKADAVVVIDTGTGHVTGFSLGARKDLVEPVTRLIAPLKQFNATTLTTDAMWGTDHFDFMMEGVPTLMANQDEGNYLLNYHAMSDTYDKVDMPELKKHVAELAAATFAIANAPERLGPRLTHAQIEQTFEDAHFDEQLKAFGLWEDWVAKKRGRAK